MEVLYELQDQLKAEIIQLIQEKKSAHDDNHASFCNGQIAAKQSFIKEIENKLLTMTI